MSPSSSPPMPPAARIEARGLTKRYGGVLALDDVSIRCRPGTVHAVVGENGAGKSTLMKILAGVQHADAGRVFVEGDEVRLDDVAAAMTLGIALIHQELNLAENLSVAANLFLGRERHRVGWMRRREMHVRSEAILRRVGLHIDPATPVGELPIGVRQLIEIAKALATDARVLIMDEPTSSLTTTETERLFDVIDDLRRRDVTVLYISHRLPEITRLADHATVLRDGKVAGELTKSQISHDELVRHMIGRDVDAFYCRKRHRLGDPVLRVDGLRTATYPDQTVSLSVREGEIVALAGLIGAGRTELLEAIFGITPPLSGTTRVGDSSVDLSTPADAIAAGFALVPEDRKACGVILDQAVRVNLSLPSLRRDATAGVLISHQRELALSESMTAAMRIKAPNDREPVKNLSGGNQQKVVIGKWMAMSPRVMLLDEPTRGVDIGAKEEIYRLIERLAADGVAVLLASSEMEEIIGIADRVIVIREGQVSGELAAGELTESNIMNLATAAPPATTAAT